MKAYRREYRSQPHVRERLRAQNRSRMRLVRGLPEILNNVLTADDFVSESDLVGRLHDVSGVRIRVETLRQLLVKYENETGLSPLNVDEDGDYILNPVFYKHL